MVNDPHPDQSHHMLTKMTRCIKVSFKMSRDKITILQMVQNHTRSYYSETQVKFLSKV